MNQKIICLLVLFSLFLIPTLVNAQASCDSYCERGIYYSNGSYNVRTEECDYSIERCESGCNERETECAIVNSIQESKTKTCDPYCADRVYYGAGEYNKETGECEYMYREKCERGCNTRGTTCYQLETVEMYCPNYCSDDTYYYNGSYDKEAKRCRYMGREVCRYGCDLRQDYCAEPGQVIEEVKAVEKTCRDSDIGIDFEEKGKVLWAYGNEEGTLNDHCVGSTLVEYYCDNDVRAVTYKECSEDGMLCKGAKCIELVEGDCIDPDGNDLTTKAWAEGTNKWNEGLVSWGDYCTKTPDGSQTDAGDYVHEAICLETKKDYYEVRYAEVRKCKDGCINGICVGSGEGETVEEVKEETTVCSSDCSCMTRETGAERFSQPEMCSNTPCDYASDGTAMYCIKSMAEKTITLRKINVNLKNELGIEEEENEYVLKRENKSFRIKNPEEAISQYVKSNEEFKSINVTFEKDTPVYEIRTERRARLLGFIPVSLRIRSIVNANDLTLIEEKRPWWSFLTRRISEELACLPPDCINLEENEIIIKKGNQGFLIRKISEDLGCVPPDCISIKKMGVTAKRQDISEDLGCVHPDCINIDDNKDIHIQIQDGKIIIKKTEQYSPCVPPQCMDLEMELGWKESGKNLVEESNPQPSPSPSDLVGESNPQPSPSDLVGESNPQPSP